MSEREVKQGHDEQGGGPARAGAPSGGGRRQGAAGGMLELQRLVGNRAVGALLGGRAGGAAGRVPAATRPGGEAPAIERARPRDASAPPFLSAHEWARCCQGALREAHAGRPAVQRDGNPVAESVNQTRHDLGRAQNRVVVLGRGLAAADAAKYKMAIKELQRRLIAVLGGRLKSGIWKRDGVFGTSTEAALRKYQRLRGLGESGQADLDTWRSLEGEAIGSARGREEFHWKETMTELGPTGTELVPEATAAFDWSKKEDAFDVNVALEFTGEVAKAKGVIADIKRYWNVFALEYKGAKGGAAKRKPKNPRVDLRFNIGSADAKAGAPKVTNDVEVFLFTPPHPNWAARGLASEQDKKERSDMLNWNVTEPSLPEMASHEFGHVIGLEDEYSRPHDAMKRIAGSVKAHTAKATIDAATSLAGKIAGAKAEPDFRAIHSDITDLAKTPGRVEAVAQVFKEQTGARLEPTWMAAAKTAHTAAKNRADVHDTEVAAAQQAAIVAMQAAGAAVQARNVVFTTKAGGFLAGADAATDAAFRQAVPALRTVGLQAKEAMKQAKAAKAAAGEASYAQSVDDHVKSVAARGTAATAAQAAMAAAQAAQQALLVVDTAVAEGTRLAGESLAKRDKEYAEAKKAAERREARAARRELAAKQATEEHESVRNAWRLRAQLGVGRGDLGVEEVGRLARASQDRGTAAANARLAADNAKAAATAAEELATKSRASGGALGDMAAVAGAEAKAGSAAGDAWSATGDKADAAALEHCESVLIWAWYTTTKDVVGSYDRAGYTAPGIMGDHYENMKAGLARENSPALEHKHPLQPRHVARFAEYIMKYKPGDLWEPVVR